MEIFKAKRLIVTAAIGFVLLLSACRPDAPQATDLPSPEAVNQPLATATVVSEPFAMRLGLVSVSKQEFLHELERIAKSAAALGSTLTSDEQKQRVIEEFTGQLLLANAAYKQGYQPDSAALDASYTQVVEARGGEEPFKQWLSGNYYDAEEFKTALARQIAANWMKARIFADLGTTAEQIHALQILVQDEAEAQQLLRQLQAGIEFQGLADQYDPLTHGDLGWFPRGYLTQPELDDPAFSLQPGGYSGVIKTSIGYHILYALERESARELSPDALSSLQHTALLKWVEQQKQSSTIEMEID